MLRKKVANRGIEAYTRSAKKSFSVYLAAINAPGAAVQYNLQRLLYMERNAQVPRQSVARTQRNNAQCCLGTHQRLRHLVYRAVSAYCYHNIELFGYCGCGKFCSVLLCFGKFNFPMKFICGEGLFKNSG